MICVPDASKERPIFNASEFGVRKSLLIKKAQLEKMGNLIIKSSLREFEIQVSYISREGGMGEVKRWWRLLDSQAEKGFKGKLEKLLLVNPFVPSWFVDLLLI